MGLAIGVIGAGIMGADHASTICHHLPKGKVVALADPDDRRVKALAQRVNPENVYADPLELIADPRVEAVVIASPDDTHAALVRRCIEIHKPVFCEKPLAPTAPECLEIVALETALYRRLVTVGFNRRFDPSYRAMKARIEDRSLGRPLMFHCTHRGAKAGTITSSEMMLTAAAVHDIDVSRWLFGNEIVRTKVYNTRTQAGNTIRNPIFLTLEADDAL